MPSKRKRTIRHGLATKKRKEHLRTRESGPAEQEYLPLLDKDAERHKEIIIENCKSSELGRSAERSMSVTVSSINNTCITSTQSGIADGNLLEKTYTQWMIGDWQSLATINPEKLDQHPDRSKLALLAAMGQIQSDNLENARKLINLAINWGAERKQISQILIAESYNSLGRIAMIAGNHEKATKHFEQSIKTGIPGVDAKIMANAKRNFYIENIKCRSILSLSNSQDVAMMGLSLSPRLIVINGMARSGSTVSMNIVTDLLGLSSVPYVKYYIADFQELEKFGDHVKQNPTICFVLKTHTVPSALRSLSNSIKTRYVYTKRNLIEVAASFIRMTRNPDSPFFRKEPLGLPDIEKFMANQITEYKKALELSDCLIVDCSELEGDNISTTISKLVSHIGIHVEESKLSRVAELRNRKNGALYSSSIENKSLTSLRHESKTFYHRNHVIEGGTVVNEYIPGEWERTLLDEFGDSIDEFGNLR